MTVKTVDTIDGDLLAEAWALYFDAFEWLNAYAVQRHLMHRAEFDAEMADSRVLKFLYLDDTGTLAGVGTYTNQLDAVPLISPAYFARRWPGRYAAGLIWYVPWVAVADTAPVTAFDELITAMHRHSGVDAISALDVCNHVRDVRHLPRATAALLRRASGREVLVERLDEQSYWLYEFGGDPGDG